MKFFVILAGEEEATNALGSGGANLFPNLNLFCPKCQYHVATNAFESIKCSICGGPLNQTGTTSYAEWDRKQMLAHSLPYLSGQLPSP